MATIKDDVVGIKAELDTVLAVVQGIGTLPAPVVDFTPVLNAIAALTPQDQAPILAAIADVRAQFEATA